MLDDLPRIAIIGRPNVGKSSFTNALLGKERNIVTPLAGTTRDSIHTRYQGYGFDFWLVDTAGVRKKSKVHEDLEFYTVMRSVKTIEKSDVCIIMIDAKDGIESQDLNLFHLAEKNRKGIVIVVNKWDLVEKDTNTSKQFEEQIYHKIAPFKDIPIIFTSVINKQRIFQALETAINVYKERSKRITTSVLNETMLPLIENYPPPALKGKYVKIKFVTQLPTATPSFAFFCNLPQYVKDPYKRFLENKIREKFGFQGVPISIFMRQK
jgi:GTP-binding protein